MKMNLSSGTFFFAGMLLLSFTSCKKEISPATAEENLLSSSVNASVKKEKKNMNDLLKSVRQATSRFHSTTQAIKAGYLPTDECVSIPGAGGMGYHWVNPSLVDGIFDPEKPEAVLYARGPGGKLRLVAVEYIVMANINTPIMFGEQPFAFNQSPIPGDDWTLHVWLYEDNPSGMFAPFNPNVTCQ